MNNKSKQSITIPAEILGLSDVEIESVTTDLGARKITIRVVSTKDEILCRGCNQPTNPHGRGRLLRLRHLPILGKETTIEIIPGFYPYTNAVKNWYRGRTPRGYEQYRGHREASE